MIAPTLWHVQVRIREDRGYIAYNWIDSCCPGAAGQKSIDRRRALGAQDPRSRRLTQYCLVRSHYCRSPTTGGDRLSHDVDEKKFGRGRVDAQLTRHFLGTSARRARALIAQGA